MCGFRYRCSNTGLQLLRRGFRVSLIPKDVKVMVRIKVTRLGELGFATRKDHRLAQSLGVSSLPIRSSISMCQICDEKARRLNLNSQPIINQACAGLVVQPSQDKSRFCYRRTEMGVDELV